MNISGFQWFEGGACEQKLSQCREKRSAVKASQNKRDKKKRRKKEKRNTEKRQC